MKLLVIDTQKLIVTDALYAFERFVQHVTTLIEQARLHGVEVIYVRHDDGEGCELTKGTAGYDIYEAFQPMAHEKIFDKTLNSAFKASGLLEYLQEQEETTLMICGLQSDYCIDANVKCAFEHGFNVIVPSYANTTVDNAYLSGEESYRYYNEFMWQHRYATCVSMPEAIEYLNKNSFK